MVSIKSFTNDDVRNVTNAVEVINGFTYEIYDHNSLEALKTQVELLARQTAIIGQAVAQLTQRHVFYVSEDNVSDKEEITRE